MSVYKTRSLQTHKTAHTSSFTIFKCFLSHHCVCPDILPILLLGPLLSLVPVFPLRRRCSWQHLSRLCGHTGNVYVAGAPSSHPHQVHLQRRRGSHPGFPGLPSSATTDLLLQWTWSAHSCLPRLCCCGALPERAAPAHWVTLWQSLKTKKKKCPQHFDLSSRELAAAQQRRACKCSFFFFFSTGSFSFPWYYLPFLQSSHLPSPSWQFPIPWRELTSISRNKSTSRLSFYSACGNWML